jgi:hypothetical protein
VLFAALLVPAWVLHALAELFLWREESWRSLHRIVAATAIPAITVGAGAIVWIAPRSWTIACALGIVVPLVAWLFRVERDRELAPGPPPDPRSRPRAAAGARRGAAVWTAPGVIYGSRPTWTLLRAIHGPPLRVLGAAWLLTICAFEWPRMGVTLLAILPTMILPQAMSTWAAFIGTPFPRRWAHAAVVVPPLFAITVCFAASHLFWGVFSGPDRVFAGIEAPSHLDYPYWMGPRPESLERFLDLSTARDREEVAEQVSRFLDFVHAVEASPGSLLAIAPRPGDAGRPARESWLLAIEAFHAGRIRGAVLRRRVFELLLVFLLVLVYFNCVPTEANQPARWARVAGLSLPVLVLVDHIWRPFVRDEIFPTSLVHEFCRHLELHPWAFPVCLWALAALFFRSRRVLA